MSVHIESMSVEHTSVSIAEPGTLLGDDTVDGWALVLSADTVTVVEGFSSPHAIANWLYSHSYDIRTGQVNIEEGDE